MTLYKFALILFAIMLVSIYFSEKLEPINVGKSPLNTQSYIVK